jgi:hypothetical protein
MGNRRVAAGVSALALIAAVAFSAPPGRPDGRPRRGRPSGQSTRGPQIGQQSTDFELPVLIERTDSKGEKVAVVTSDKIKLSSYRDKKVVCVFMSSYT